MVTEPTPRDSLGARFGNAGHSMGLGAADPRARRAAQAALTDAEKGAFVKRDELGRDTLDIVQLKEELAKGGE